MYIFADVHGDKQKNQLGGKKTNKLITAIKTAFL